MPKLIRVSIALTVFVLSAILLSQVQAKPHSTAPTPLPTLTLMPTATFAPNAFSLVGAATYKASNDAFEILLPNSWVASPLTVPNAFTIYYGDVQNPTMILQVQITTPAALISAPTPPTNSKEAMQAIRDSFDSQLKAQQLPAESTMTTIAPVKIGKLQGVGFILSVPDGVVQPGVVFDFRIADLPHGKILFAYSQSSNAAWVRAKQLIANMFASLVIHPDAIPTATPTLTPISLQSQLSTLDATSVALTPTKTPRPTKFEEGHS